MAQGTILLFSGTTLFCGVDVHKRNWSVNIHGGEFELKQFSQDANPVLLHKVFSTELPGSEIQSLLRGRV